MKHIAYLIPLAAVIAMTGCASSNTSAETSERATAAVGIVNHTGSYIYMASVDGAGGGNMARWGGGHPEYLLHVDPASMVSRHEGHSAMEYAYRYKRCYQGKSCRS